ncbi:rCG58023 [Rattus norvegicus]|uniref:RCG58023 n=1 Tax=Rattus norvegicus TaxID=10116 RepID=A6J550_RAT|nr:rCG58023 [Rattus norvegicus]
MPKTNSQATAGGGVWKWRFLSAAQPGVRFFRLPERPPPWRFNPFPSVLPATCSLNLATSAPSSPATLAGHLAANKQDVLPHRATLRGEARAGASDNDLPVSF